jgi:putative FmdB family regulatory protein
MLIEGLLFRGDHMPTYEYECGNCEHLFEEFQPITAKPLKKCPECKKLKLRRLIGGGSGLIFKGSGFYITDYRSDSYKAAAKKDSNASGGGESKSSSDGGKKEKKASKPKAD